MQHHAQGFNVWKQDNQHLKYSPETYTATHIFALNYRPSLTPQILLLIYIYSIQISFILHSSRTKYLTNSCTPQSPYIHMTNDSCNPKFQSSFCIFHLSQASRQVSFNISGPHVRH